MLAGCATKPVKSNLVEIIPEGTTPTRKYTKVKLLYNVNWSSKETDAMNYFVKKAEALGADAIIIQPKENEGFKVYPFGKVGYKYRYKALAVKWTD